MRRPAVDVLATDGTAVFTARSAETNAEYMWYQGNPRQPSARRRTARHADGDGGSQLTISGLTFTTTYWCRFTAGRCVVDSNVAQAIVCASPRIIVPDGPPKLVQRKGDEWAG